MQETSSNQGGDLSAVSIQREQSAQEAQVKFSQRGSWEHRRTSSCLIVRVIYVRLEKCSNEVAQVVE
jgi:hypothetical protein